MAARGMPKQLMVMKARLVVQQRTSGRSLSALPAAINEAHWFVGDSPDAA